MIEIEIDGKKIEAEQGAMVIEVADANHIPIPRFCYHKKLSVAANCRMCLVEVEKVGKPLPACATPVTAGMKVWTQSPAARAAQKSVMEFLLINHPLDCPICDQGGQCELQDVSMGYGKDASRYTEEKRVVKDKDLGPLVATDMTRCIHCTRCVRFGQEIAGIREMGATGRGEKVEIGTYIEKSLVSELSGNIIDLCPVGALTSKPFRYQARAWELQQTASIAPHDALGSHMFLHTRAGKVMRAVPRENEDINEVWLSDRDRYSYAGIHSETRLQKPLIKLQGVWQETDWQTALSACVDGMYAVFKNHGADAIAALASPNSTVEELYLWQKLWRSIGVPHIDHRLRHSDFSDQNEAPLAPTLNCAIADIETREAIIVIGAHLWHEQPLLGHRVRQAYLQGVPVHLLHVLDVDMHHPLAAKVITSPQNLVQQLAAVVKALADKNANSAVPLPAWLKDVKPSKAAEKFVEKLEYGKQNQFILGAYARQHPEAAVLRALTHLAARLLGSESQVGELDVGANHTGAWLAGALPHRQAGGVAAANIGEHAKHVWEKPKRAYALLGIEPNLDVADVAAAQAALSQADFVMSLSAFDSAELRACSHVILPISTFAEMAGTFVNTENKWQSFSAAVLPVGESRPAWKVLRVLGNLFGKDGFDYQNAEEVREEVRAVCDAAVNTNSEKWDAPLKHYTPKTVLDNVWMRIVEWPIYRTDMLVRASLPLQNTPINEPACVRIHPELNAQFKNAQRIKVRQHKIEITLPLVLDARVPLGAVWIPAGFPETSVFSSEPVAIELEAV